MTAMQTTQRTTAPEIKITSGGLTLPDICDMDQSSLQDLIAELKQLRDSPGLIVSANLEISVASYGGEVSSQTIAAMERINHTPGSEMTLSGNNGHTMHIPGPAKRSAV